MSEQQIATPGAAVPAAEQQAPAAPLAPAAAPAVEVPVAIPQEPAAPATPEPAPQTSGIFEPSGDPGLDYAMSFVHKAGFTEDSPALQAALQGDFGLIKAELASKGIEGWEQAVALGERAFEQFQKDEEVRVGAIREGVQAVASQMGVDWESSVNFARENATPEQTEALNLMFEDPYTAKMAALWITHAYSASQGAVKVPAPAPVNPNAAPAQAAGQGALTRAEFAAEAGKLHKRFGDSYNQTPDYRALVARRRG